MLAGNDANAVRMALLKGLIVFDTLVQDTKGTLSPFVNYMNQVGCGTFHNVYTFHKL